MNVEMTMNICPISHSDVQALIALWDTCGLIRQWNDPATDIARARAAPQTEIFILKDGDTLVASVMTGNDGHRGWLYYLAVAENRRHQGFGRKIIRHAEVWLHSQGVPKVELMIRPGNEEAKGFYEAIDYQMEPRLIMSRWLDHNADHKATHEYKMLEVTTTYLQMRQQPKTISIHPPSIGLPIALLRSEKPSIHFYRYLYNTIGEPWLWYERRALNDTSLAKIIKNPLVEIYILYAGGAPAGYAELDRRVTGEIEVAYFGLLPEYIGLGLGNWLLDCTINTAWHHEPNRLWIHTCTLDHPAALRLYQRAGFEPYKQETGQIVDPRHSGVLGTRN